MPGRKPKYASDKERKAAARERARLKDLPRKLTTARRRHSNVVKEIRRADMDDLLVSYEEDWT